MKGLIPGRSTDSAMRSAIAEVLAVRSVEAL